MTASHRGDQKLDATERHPHRIRLHRVGALAERRLVVMRGVASRSICSFRRLSDARSCHVLIRCVSGCNHVLFVHRVTVAVQRLQRLLNKYVLLQSVVVRQA